VALVRKDAYHRHEGRNILYTVTLAAQVITKEVSLNAREFINSTGRNRFSRMAATPAPKACQPLLNEASRIESRDPVIAYYCMSEDISYIPEPHLFFHKGDCPQPLVFTIVILGQVVDMRSNWP
jgi:hypothetical protein